jgi:hypothetical protein
LATTSNGKQAWKDFKIKMIVDPCEGKQVTAEVVGTNLVKVQPAGSFYDFKIILQPPIETVT